MGDIRRIAANAAFRRLAIAQFCSSMGDWMKIGFLISLVLQLSGGSAMAVAGIMIAKMLPALFLTTTAHALTDRFDQRKLMIASDLTRAALILVLLTSSSLALIYIVLFFMELASRLYWPARDHLAQCLVEPAGQRRAQGFLTAAQRIAMLVGLAASGIIVRAFEHLLHFIANYDVSHIAQGLIDYAPIAMQTRIGYLANVLLFLISAGLIFSLRKATKTAACGPAPSPFTFSFRELARDAAEPFRLVHSKPELRTIVIAISIAVIGGAAAGPIALSYITALKGVVPLEDTLAWISAYVSSRQIFLIAYIGVGVVAGYALFARIKHQVNTGFMFSGALMIFAAAMVAFAFNTSYLVACVIALLAGACIAALFIASNTYLQQHVHIDQRSKLFAAVESLPRALVVISMLVLTPLSDAISATARTVFVEARLDDLLGVALTGPRFTMVLSAFIVAVAAVYSFITLYWKPRSDDLEELLEEEAQAHNLQ